jgi:hypothetical protein
MRVELRLWIPVAILYSKSLRVVVEVKRKEMMEQA